MTTARYEFDGLAALVTGAAGGIGLAIAERLSQGGARIVACDRDESRLEIVARGLAGNTVAVAGDVGTEDGVETLVACAIAQAGAIDILVNGAGIAEPILRTVDQKLADWQRVMDVNLRGTFLVSRAIGRHLLARKAPGAIVNISSVAGLGGIPGSNGYGVSKAALVHLTRTLATEWARKGIRVNCVAPGYIDAPMAIEMFAGGKVDRTLIERRTPVGRLGRPEEIAAAVAFLASNAASFITGVTLPVDGGWSAYGGP